MIKPEQTSSSSLRDCKVTLILKLVRAVYVLRKKKQTSRSRSNIVMSKYKTTLLNSVRSVRFQNFRKIHKKSKLSCHLYVEKTVGISSHCPNIDRKENQVCTQTQLYYDNLPRPTKAYYTCKKSNIICNQCS